MTFWNLPQLEPSRKYRFQIQTPDSATFIEKWWWAKSISKPSYEFNTNEYQLGNHKFKFPGVLTWKDIEIIIIDDNSHKPQDGIAINRTAALMSNLSYIYSIPTDTAGYSGDDAGAKRPTIDGSIRTIIIDQLDSDGKPLETWTLHDAFVKSVDFGQLAYEDDGLVEITISISYDYATINDEQVAPAENVTDNN